ncbi:MAG TPA: hypothetical protein VIX58_02855, partial [Anaerolineae bacterium]
MPVLERHHIRTRFVVLFILLIATAALVSTHSAHAAMSPRVLAFYYAWYDNNTWNYNTVPDLPAQPYESYEPNVIARHIQQAQSAGIDAFVVSWIGTNYPTDANFRTMLERSRAAGFAAT